MGSNKTYDKNFSTMHIKANKENRNEARTGSQKGEKREAWPTSNREYTTQNVRPSLQEIDYERGNNELPTTKISPKNNGNNDNKTNLRSNRNIKSRRLAEITE